MRAATFCLPPCLQIFKLFYIASLSPECLNFIIDIVFSTQEYLKIKSSKVCITSIAIYFLRRESTISLSQDYIATDSKLVYTSCIKYMRKMLFWVNNFTGLASLQLIHFLQSQKISLAWQLFDSVEFITGFVWGLGHLTWMKSLNLILNYECWRSLHMV